MSNFTENIQQSKATIKLMEKYIAELELLEKLDQTIKNDIPETPSEKTETQKIKTPKTETPKSQPNPMQSILGNFLGGNMGGINGISGLGGLGGLQNNPISALMGANMGNLGGLSNLMNQNANTQNINAQNMTTPKSIEEVQSNPQMMSMLKNLESNPQMLQSLSSMTGMDSNKILSAVGGITGKTPTSETPNIPTQENTPNQNIPMTSNVPAYENQPIYENISTNQIPIPARKRPPMPEQAPVAPVQQMPPQKFTDMPQIPQRNSQSLEKLLNKWHFHTKRY